MTSASEQTAKAAEIAASQPPVDLPAPHVIEALRRVMRDLPAIRKDQSASREQGGYAYRGIEQITQHTQGLFAKHGVIFSPRVVHYEVKDITVNNKPWTDTIELVEYDVYGPGGIEDRITVGPILAIGRDNSDKGANKCLTQAYKYALLQALSISDAKDDGDGATHEADARPEPEWDEKMTQFELLNALDGDKDEARQAWEWANERGDLIANYSHDTAHAIADAWKGRPL